MTEIFEDPKEPAERRAKDLLSKMTLEEKVAQLSSVWTDELLDNDQFSEEKAKKLLSNGIGEITRIAGRGLKPRDAARLVNQIQKYLKEKTRLKIPVIVHEECLAGLQAPTATSFPQAIALASTWNLELMNRVASTIGRHVATVGAKQGLAPVLDLALDPRWGRTEETYGEDPYPASSMGVAYVSALQAQGVIATGKHFAGHGSSEGGRNTAPVNVSERFFRENHLRTFEAAVKAAGLRSIMPAYHQLDGVPCHANRWLLSGVLRGEWGFSGITVSDYDGVPRLMNIDGFRST